MTFSLTMECDNAAFSISPAHEVSRILKRLADKLEANPDMSDGDKIGLVDFNGNKVGVATVTGDPETEDEDLDDDEGDEDV